MQTWREGSAALRLENGSALNGYAKIRSAYYSTLVSLLEHPSYPTIALGMVSFLLWVRVTSDLIQFELSILGTIRSRSIVAKISIYRPVFSSLDQALQIMRLFPLSKKVSN